MSIPVALHVIAENRRYTDITFFIRFVKHSVQKVKLVTSLLSSQPSAGSENNPQIERLSI
jgi:hypothetical protein